MRNLQSGHSRDCKWLDLLGARPGTPGALSPGMKRIITLTALVLGLTGGIAAADHGRGGWDRRDNRDRWDNRDHRTDRRWDRGNRWDRRDRVVIQRTRPSFRDGRWYFAGGFHRPYYRPVINVRYRDYYRRPALIVENYDAVPGYVWVQGSWNWNGYEWIWTQGHYEVDANYDGYGDGYYQNDGYYQDDTYYQGAPTIQGGVTIGGSVRF